MQPESRHKLRTVFERPHSNTSYTPTRADFLLLKCRGIKPAMQLISIPTSAMIGLPSWRSCANMVLNGAVLIGKSQIPFIFATFRRVGISRKTCWRRLGEIDASCCSGGVCYGVGRSAGRQSSNGANAHLSFCARE